MKNNLLNLDHFNILEIEGKGAEELLQGQLTCDVTKIKGNKFCLGSLCNVKGRVVSSFILCERPSDGQEKKYWLISNQDMLKKTQDVLNKYSPFYEVTLTVNNKPRVFALDDQTRSLIHKDISKQEHLYSESKKSLIFSYLGKKLNLIVFYGDIKFDDKFNIINNISEWNLDNLKAKDVEITVENSEKFTPHDLNFNEHRIDFEKGCYTGQEIIARMQYRAKSLPELYKAISKSFCKINEKVINSEGKSLGSVVQSFKEGRKYHCLLSLKNFDYEESIYLKGSKELLEVKN